MRDLKQIQLAQVHRSAKVAQEGQKIIAEMKANGCKTTLIKTSSCNVGGWDNTQHELMPDIKKW